jgi:phosphoribosylformylglycinamidine synthase
MISFFKTSKSTIITVLTKDAVSTDDVRKLEWLFAGIKLNDKTISGAFVGPRNEMVSPWSTNAVEITQNMGIKNIIRIEEYQIKSSTNDSYDKMLEQMYDSIGQDQFNIKIEPEPIIEIDDIAQYNKQEGLALSDEEVKYLDGVGRKIGRKLTDSEVFGFSQVNSEHCRHKIFNGRFIINGEEKETSLFNLIRKTSKENPNTIISAYKDNVSFVKGPKVMQFSPKTQNKADFFETKEIETVLSLKAETHNFPTTVEPFNGAATGAGGEIRDRMAGGKGSVPMAGTAVYMTSYSRLENHRKWEKGMKKRNWLYQTPMDILIKASNGASDFGNKFGQPMINGSVLTFEHDENGKKYGFDKVIMLAGGIGYAKNEDAIKALPKQGDKIVIIGGDNYRIGMGGSAVSSVDTGEMDSSIELNAIQRSNPEMQKRAMNAVRAFSESSSNPIISIHDHGAGGHLNCLSELVEETGGKINLGALPVGDPTLSAKEIVGNESQERMGLVIKKADIPLMQEICKRERAPMYVVGDVTGDHQFTFEGNNQNPIDLQLDDMFGNPPKTILEDTRTDANFGKINTDITKIEEYLEQVLQLEAVACKDWLTNKVDRSVTGKVAKQQCAGELQLPLNNLGAVALDFTGKSGIATAMGHAPVPALIDPVSGSKLAIAESLTNIVFAPLKNNLKSISLSANWMWPAKNQGENARLYDAVESISDFACDLGINIPTGKDSLSMVQKYPNGEKVYSPGTVVISASGEIDDVKKIIEPVVEPNTETDLLYIDFSNDEFKIGGSSLSQVLNSLGDKTPSINDNTYFGKAFNAVQELIKNNKVLSGHDISEGGLITALLEMNFSNSRGGMNINLDNLGEDDPVKVLFSEKPAIIIQVKNSDEIIQKLAEFGVFGIKIGSPSKERTLNVSLKKWKKSFDINAFRNIWYRTSFLLDQHQSTPNLAKERFQTFADNPIEFNFPASFLGSLDQYDLKHKRKNSSGVKAAIIREKGVNGDREMAYAMYLSGFDVKDIHMTDLISGKENLADVNFIVFVGGFSNSDVLGSAKGWAGAFKYNKKANEALINFYDRKDTLSLGVCNGCQLMMELGLIQNTKNPKAMLHNDSGKFESNYLSVNIPKNNSVMLNSLSDSKLGIFIAHGEGKFDLSDGNYNIAMTYTSSSYPTNPNGSDSNAAAVVSDNGRHLAMMPHLERVIFPWQCAHYPKEKKLDEVTPWIEAFVNAFKWVKKN